MNTCTLRYSALATALAAALMPNGSAGADSRTMTAARMSTPDSVRAQVGNERLLMFRAGSYDPTVQRLDLSATPHPDASSERYAIVQFHRDAVASGRRDLQTQGIEFLGYVPNDAYIVRLNGHALDAVNAHPAVRAAERYATGLKIDPRLWSNRRDSLPQQKPEQATSAQELLDIVDIRGFPGESAPAIEAALRKQVSSARILRRSDGSDAAPYVRAAIERPRLDDLLDAASSIEAVAFIEPWLPTVLHNAGSVGAIQGNSLAMCGGVADICGPAPLWEQGILGSGQIVAVFDSGTTPWAASFTTLDKGSGPLTSITLADDPPPTPPAIGQLYPDRKIVAYWLQPNGATNYDYSSQHGTHTSGTVLGDLAGTFGTTTYLASTPAAAHHELADGMAPNAQLLMQDGGGADPNAIYVSDFTDVLDQAYAGGARIHNDSWGAGTAGTYTALDAAADRAAWRDEDLLVVISAGNNGSSPVQTGSPSNAKNVLSVAALAHAGGTTVPWWSSRGPAADGRQKPDIAAPGDSIWSVSASLFSATPTYNAPAVMSGTSMAAPTISGNAALVRQYFTDGFYPRGVRTLEDAYNPSGMVLKAVLLNSTNPLGAPTWPNADSGWGRAWLDGNLWFRNTTAGGDDSRRLRIFERTRTSGLTTGEVQEYTLHHVQAGAELRVTLTWFDPEATFGVALALVNDLDLEVVAPDGTIYKGNVFTDGVSAAGGDADAINTVEQVRLTAPLEGSYTLRVDASSVPGNGHVDTDRQGYALVASGAFGLPDPVPADAPTSVHVLGNDTAGVSIAFDGSSDAQAFQLYRADGTCANAATGDFRLVDSGPASPLLDTHSQGGLTYAYKLRGIADDVEGLASACVDVISADDCTLRPAIAAASLDGNGWNTACSVNLAWQAATPTCAGASSAVTYNVYRSTDAFMADPIVVADGVATTDFVDTDVVNGRAYYYQFNAVDSLGNRSERSDIATATTASPLGPDPSAFHDNADSMAYLEMDPDWAVSSIASADGTYSYHTGGQASYYPDMNCSSIETPALALPADARLSFSARYNLEYGWDGVVTEISTDDGATWADLPPDGGYPTTLNTGQIPPINACGFWDGKGVFSGVSTSIANAAPGNETAVAVFKPFSIDLAGFSGQTVRIRWRFSSDPAASYSGFFLDDVRIGEAGVLFRNGFDVSAYMCR